MKMSGRNTAEPVPTRAPYVEPLAPRQTHAAPKRFSAKTWTVLFCALTLGMGAAATWMFAPESQDQVSPAQAQQRQEAFEHMAPLQLKAIAPAEQDARLAEMQLPPAAQASLKQVLQTSTQDASAAAQGSPGPAAQSQAAPNPSAVRLVELVLWDSDAPDGDIVRVVSGGYSRDVVLQKQPLLLAVPVQGSTPIQIVGVHDGGGGITLGVKGGSQSVMAPVLSVGQTIALPIAL